MAKQRFGINDGYRGTVGTVIGYMWRGKWCMRARPRFVRNPCTPKQQTNRLLFKQMVSLAGNMKLALRKGLHALSMEQHMTECNYFVKYNRECFALDGEGRMTVDWENLIVSDGALAAPVFEAPEVEGSRLTVPFAPCAEGERASGDDEVYLWAYCPAAGEGLLSASAWRRTRQVQIVLPESWQGKEVHLYGFAVDHKGTASPTTYIGVLTSTEETQPDNVTSESESLRIGTPRSPIFKDKFVSTVRNVVDLKRVVDNTPTIGPRCSTKGICILVNGDG